MGHHTGQPSRRAIIASTFLRSFSVLLITVLAMCNAAIAGADKASSDPARSNTAKNDEERTMSRSTLTHVDYQAAIVAWERVLNQHVDTEGRVDFAAIRDKPADLDRIVSVVADYGPTTNPQDFSDRKTVIAYHINTYNALAMRGVIDRGIPDNFNGLLKKASFFKFRSVRISGTKTNLYDYENKVIRPLGEPRVHFALNCMVKDCPRLPSTPFTPEDLDADLDRASWEFFSKERHLRIDHANKRIEVSAILDFYTKDFVESGRTRDLPLYINQYQHSPLPEGYKVAYLDYDWRINRQS
ncbi:MAG: hypothetical protein Cons2KO_33880 [Congregibacter sp.]